MSIYVKQSSGISPIIDYDNLMQVSNLTTTSNGVITFPHIKTRFVFGVYPFEALQPSSASGGYIARIDLTQYNFVNTKSLWTNCAATYPSGMPLCCINEIATDHITLFGNVSVGGAYICWCVLGPYSD